MFSFTYHNASSLKFSFYDTESIRKISVKEITSSLLFDALNVPISGGLYDPNLGPIFKPDRCSTCHLSYFLCPGHFGHIELPATLYNPLLLSHLGAIVKHACPRCSHFRFHRHTIHTWIIKLKLLKHGLYLAAKELDNLVCTWSTADNVNNKRKSLDQSLIADRPNSHYVIQKLDSYYEDQIKSIPPLDQKSSLIEQECNNIMSEFKLMTHHKACNNCSAKSIQTRQLPGTILFRSSSGNEMHDIEIDHIESNESEHDDTDDSQGNSFKAIKNSKKDPYSREIKGQIYDPIQLFQYVKNLWENEKDFLTLLFGESPSMFFIDVIPVPPNKFRPPAKLGDALMDNPQNSFLKTILENINTFVSLKQSQDQTNKLIKTWTLIQDTLTYMYDSSKMPVKYEKQVVPGIKQTLEKKEGLFRQHMMGKRVNHSARSVISPDVNIGTNEIGIPKIFAMKLVVPEQVTPFNLHKLRQCIINGAASHPGATFVQYEDGSMHNLIGMSKESREAISNQLLTSNEGKLANGNGLGGLNKTVYRYLANGDMLLVNRQPTLHKPSIMAHKCRVLPGERTIRLHYANCDTYNADFDGDEMNIHLPQSDLGRAEAIWIANTDLQYLVPTDGSPLRGLIQDHVDAGVILSIRGTWLTKDIYHQLLTGCLPEEQGKIFTEPPTIVKPTRLWSGKQLISTLLTNVIIFTKGQIDSITMIDSKCKLPTKLFPGKNPSSEEGTVTFLEGYYVHGILDKAQFGASSYGLVHHFYEFYGPETAGLLLTILGKLFTRILQMIGFSCGMDDIVLRPDTDADRQNLVSSNEIGDQVFRKEFGSSNEQKEFVFRNEEARKELDSHMKAVMGQKTGEIIERTVPKGVYKPFPSNNMTMMTMSGAKGSIVNFSQISGALGQQELEGRRVPIMPSGKTLPCFIPFDTSARAGGYISDRFLSGIRPQEYFFHCMAGREGLIDTAVKTSRSGYLQRCLIKHLEDVHVQNDLTVRDAEGCILQFYYGEDGLDVTKQAFLSKFSTMSRNIGSIIERYKPAQILDQLDTKSIMKYMKINSDNHLPMESYSPAISLGSVSDEYSKNLEDYLTKTAKLNSNNDLCKHLLSKTLDIHTDSEEIKRFRALMWLKYMRSLAEPGESVGILAAQSIGEPSTQMTLNTFHLAGFGAQNVTLGIPRLREIIMVASKTIKTPTMSIPLKPHIKKIDAERFVQSYTRIALSELVKAVQITEKLGYQIHTEHIRGTLLQNYNIVLHLDNPLEKDNNEHIWEYFQKGFQMDFCEKIKILLTGSKLKDDTHEDEKTRHKKDDFIKDIKIDVKESESQILIDFSIIPKNGSLPVISELIEQILTHCIIRKISGITDCFLAEQGSSLAIVTQGVNIAPFAERVDGLEYLDFKKLVSNDINYMLVTYGVEAARQTIIKEIASVFSAYGISVDIRHLQLIADYMTLSGGYKAMNRTGMTSNISPLAKMTFESCMKYLKDAVICHDIDLLKHPSASLILGQPPKTGTGMAQIVQPANFY